MMADDTKQTTVLFDKSFQTMALPNPDSVDDSVDDGDEEEEDEDEIDENEEDDTDTVEASASVEVRDPYLPIYLPIYLPT